MSQPVRSLNVIVELLGFIVCAMFIAGVVDPVVAAESSGAGSAPTAVLTYHYDNLRTGWNHSETQLSASAFPSSFGVLQTVALDDQVDAQPLLVPGLTINGATHNVVYAVTESDSVYAIDADSGAILLQRSLGAPVPWPLGCGNNGPNVGINGTPVINQQRGVMYVIAYVNGTTPSYQLHALSLTTLADTLPPVTVAATHQLTDGSTYNFNALNQRQRPGMIEVNGVIYAGFGSFCDFNSNDSRGWVLGWNASTLRPIANSELNDTQVSSATDFFLSSVWMSGFGLASNGSNLFFATGNSDCNFYVSPEACPPSTTYDGVTNIQESVVSMNLRLSARAGVFTPSNVFTLDIEDNDLGSGGVMVLPPQQTGANLTVNAGKDGRLFLLNSTNLAQQYDVEQLSNGCWCGPAYFQGSDGINRVVTSAGNTLQTWQLQLSPAPHLVAEGSVSILSGQDPGFLTSVSSNGKRAGSAILWAVGRPVGSTAVRLYAFAANAANGTYARLYSGVAGTWPNTGGNANIVPVVANGKVYVAANQTLTIFGAGGHAGVFDVRAQSTPAHTAHLGPQRVTGTLLSAGGTRMQLLTREGTVEVALEAAVRSQRMAILVPGQPYTVQGVRAAGRMQANAVARAKGDSASWPDDL